MLTPRFDPFKFPRLILDTNQLITLQHTSRQLCDKARGMSAHEDDEYGATVEDDYGVDAVRRCSPVYTHCVHINQRAGAYRLTTQPCF